MFTQTKTAAPAVIEPDTEARNNVEAVKAPQREAYAKAMQIHADSSRTAQWKSEAITQLFADATTEVEARADAFRYTPDKKTQAAALTRIAVDPAEASAYVATKGVIEATVSNMDLPGFVAFWEERLAVAEFDSKEKLTLRILLDNLPKLRGRDETNQQKRMGFSDTLQVQQLAEKTKQVLMSDDQRAAIKKLEQMRANQEAIEAARREAAANLRAGWYITASGEFVSAASAANQRRIRGSF